MDDFHSCLNDCGLKHLGYKGRTFTWSRGNSPSMTIKERLDRFVVCSHWQDIFNSFEIHYSPIYCSAHNLIWFNIVWREGVNRGQKLFRFESLWLSCDNCIKLFKKHGKKV